jgi:hypothetical protein
MLQVKRIEALREPTVDRVEKIAGLLLLALITPQTRDAGCCAQLPGLRVRIWFADRCWRISTNTRDLVEEALRCGGRNAG